MIVFMYINYFMKEI